MNVIIYLKKFITTQSILFVIDIFAKTRKLEKIISKTKGIQEKFRKKETFKNRHSPPLSLTSTPIWCTVI